MTGLLVLVALVGFFAWWWYLRRKRAAQSIPQPIVHIIIPSVHLQRHMSNKEKITFPSCDPSSGSPPKRRVAVRGTPPGAHVTFSYRAAQPLRLSAHLLLRGPVAIWYRSRPNHPRPGTAFGPEGHQLCNKGMSGAPLPTMIAPLSLPPSPTSVFGVMDVSIN